MAYAIEVKVACGTLQEVWGFLHDDGDTRPFVFATSDDAEYVINLLYSNCVKAGLMRVTPYTGPGGLETRESAVIKLI
jgi:hypothetical protein